MNIKSIMTLRTLLAATVMALAPRRKNDEPALVVSTEGNTTFVKSAKIRGPILQILWISVDWCYTVKLAQPMEQGFQPTAISCRKGQWESSPFFTGGVSVRERCEQVSSRFQEFCERGRYLTQGMCSGLPVICFASSGPESPVMTLDKSVSDPAPRDINVTKDPNGKTTTSLSALEEDILSSVFKEERYGLEIIESIYKASKNRREIRTNSLYPTLRRMEEKGYITSRWGDETNKSDSSNGARRRYYQATDEGKDLLRHTLAYRCELAGLDNAQLQPA